MKNKKKKNINTEVELMEVSAEELVETLAIETLNIFRESVMEDAERQRLFEMYLATLVNFKITEMFGEINPDISHTKQYEQAKKGFERLKADIEFAVSDGFQNGLSNYSGKHVGYYCLIRPIPEAVNKTVM